MDIIIDQFAKDPWNQQQVCNTLKFGKKNNLFNGWYVVAIFRYHVVWPQKNNEF